MKWSKPEIQAILNEADVEHMDLLGDWSWSGQGNNDWSGQTAPWCGQGGSPWTGQGGNWKGQS